MLMYIFRSKIGENMSHSTVEEGASLPVEPETQKIKGISIR